MLEEAMVITHMNSPEGMEHSRHSPLYTLQANDVSSPLKKNIQEMKICEGWRGFDIPPPGYKLYNEGKPVVDQSFVHNLNSQIK